MNPYIQRVFDKTVQLFKNNPMVIAAYHSGSIGTDREDEFSDVDPVFVIKRESFMEFDKQLPVLFEDAIGKPILWWPERWIWRPGAAENIDIHRNYAIFFELDGKLLQYDMNFVAAPQQGRIKVSKNQFIFDKVDVLEIIPVKVPVNLDKRKLRWTIEMYWIYVYIHAKYIKRRDLFRLLYAQQELFHEHLIILQYLDSNPTQGWWPLVANGVDQAKQAHLVQYFNTPDVDVITEKLQDQVHLFSRDARQACSRWQVDYPDEFESYILEYIKDL